jgi:EpsI family protein
MKKQYITVIVILFFTAIWSLFWNSNVPCGDVTSADKIPMGIAGWQGEPLEVAKETLEILETTDAVLRRYTKNGVSVYLWVVFAGKNRKAVHPMEVCYAANGWDVGVRDVYPLPVIYKGKEYNLPCVKLIANRGEDKGLVIYFYKAGNHFTDNYYRQQLNMVLEQILLRNTESALFGIWAEEKAMDVPEKISVIEDFIKELFPYID